jgi:ABC-type taurine transport system ATPase subunit
MAATLVADATRAPAAGRAFRLQGVTHRYEGTNGIVTALSGLDLDVAAGEFLTVVGPSGCGKTTLLQLVAGFVTPTGGSVTVGGVPVTGPDSDRGVVFQHPTSLYPWLTVRGNVELGLRLRGVGKAARRARALTELERVGLADVAESAPYELSGGMQQRCQIARVLANDPAVMLMDEPFGALDAITRERLQDELIALWNATARTVVFITHSVDEAVLLGSRIIVLSPRPGRIIVDRPLPFSASGRRSDDLRADPAFTAAAHDVRAAIARELP